ncbi:MAG: flagellar hook-basal body complex protein FliE [Bacteriovoracaceae bacterium]|nr:flagellar hook-basal body complex protein FliE [Bacteriovoracaceae bacterium]
MIKNLGQLDQTLGLHDAKGWSKSVGNNISDQFSNLENPEIGQTGEGAKTFGEFLQDSIGKVNAMQNDANTAMQKLASGESKDLHETLLAVEKAEIAFKAMNQVRSKVIDAYKEIMRIQI